MKHILHMTKIAIVSGALLVPAFAQTPADDQPYTGSADRGITDDSSGNWGWVGLLGLIGLMGLRRPNEYNRTRTDMNPMGSRP